MALDATGRRCGTGTVSLANNGEMPFDRAASRAVSLIVWPVLSVVLVGTMILASRMLDYRVYYVIWPYLFATVVLSVVMAPLLSARTGQRLLAVFLLNVVIFLVAGLLAGAMGLALWDPQVEAPQRIFLVPVGLALVWVFVWPVGARLLLGASWTLSIALAVMFAMPLPLVIIAGTAIAALARPLQ